MKGMDDLEEYHETSLQDILIRLLEGDQDLDLKTQIHNPKDLASLSVFAEYLKIEGFEESGDLILEFLDKYERLMVSFDRASRKEIIMAISNMLEKEIPQISIGERLTTNLKKGE